jgi:hypothetical protein
MRYFTALRTILWIILVVPLCLCFALFLMFPGMVWGSWKGLIHVYLRGVRDNDNTNIVQFRGKK